jgi:hypothetical protein
VSHLLYQRSNHPICGLVSNVSRKYQSTIIKSECLGRGCILLVAVDMRSFLG